MTKIEWTERTWNPIVGCSIVSPGCTNCYAMRMAARLEAMSATQFPQYQGTTQPSKAGPVWTGKVALAPEATLRQPLHRRKPTMYFVNSMGDLFHEDVPDAWIDHVFAVMSLCPQHTFQVLTKRSARMRAYLTDTEWRGRELLIDDVREKLGKAHLPGFDAAWTFDHGEALWMPRANFTEENWRQGKSIQFCGCVDAFPLPNVWLGVSAERQQEADARIPDLLATPAAVRFVSCEPLLGPVDLTASLYHDAVGISHRGYLRDKSEPDDYHFHTPKLDWVIAGGESGPGARPMHPDWARALRDQCQGAEVPFFFKQWGEWALFADGDGEPDQRWAHRRDWMLVDRDGCLDVPDCRWPAKEDHQCAMLTVGKARAGRLLDGREWNGMPAPQRTEVAA